MKALHTGLLFGVDEMKQRLLLLESRAAKKRQLALEAMSEVGFTKLEKPDFDESARAGSPAIIVIAEDKIPNTYWLPQPPKLDRQAILGELKRRSHGCAQRRGNRRNQASARHLWQSL